MFSSESTSIDHIQSRLIILAAFFLGIFSISLTVVPAVQAGTWDVSLRWSALLVFIGWALCAFFTDRETRRRLPERDPYILPAGLLLSGWGILTILRLAPDFGLRQGLWLVISSAAFILILRLPRELSILRRYKYIWLTSGLLLTALTLVFGTNPSGWTPRLWLGCCGVYFQPSEPLKLLLIVYLAAFLADRRALQGPVFPGLMPLLAPTLVMIGLALLLLAVQRDLGTASVLLFIYATVVYAASGRLRILTASLGGLILAGIGGYFFFDVVRIRVDAWINPWADPAGGSYQIIQSLLAVANGGILGRGSGLGSPGLVPVPHSDFIYAAIAEETGLIGSIGLLLILALLLNRGLRLALRAPDTFRRYLAAGITIHLVGQSILIIGGNLRLMPLTGVTLPFVSYGGSSLLISFLSLGLLMQTSEREDSRPAPLYDSKPYLVLSALLGLGLAAAAVFSGWWSVIRGPDLLTRTDNARRSIADRFVQRGSLLDRNEQPIMESIGSRGSYERVIRYPDLSPVAGYTHPIYGQSGLEASLDPYLRGLEGNPDGLIWQHLLMTGMPPPGINVRLSIDLEIQQFADEALSGHSGSLVLLNAETGEILAMASQPAFNANELEAEWNSLIQDNSTPLFNRAALGQYQPGSSLGPFLLAAVYQQGSLPEIPESLDYVLNEKVLTCAYRPGQTWGQMVAAGCPGANIVLAQSLSPGGDDGTDRVQEVYTQLGFYSPPNLRLDVLNTELPETFDFLENAVGQSELRVSPLQMAAASASISSGGYRPALKIAIMINEPQRGWVRLPDLESQEQIYTPEAAFAAAQALQRDGEAYWETTALASAGSNQTYTWYLAGTIPEWNGVPLAMALIVEEASPEFTEKTGREIMESVMGR
ncbi:MAG: hypothetical protein EHM41_01460 [Chloroflexi bacterium]|nr:MAG: hypothetical protein EHM41_01460 [Chloroflexota bacterium]